MMFLRFEISDFIKANTKKKVKSRDVSNVCDWNFFVVIVNGFQPSVVSHVIRKIKPALEFVYIFRK